MRRGKAALTDPFLDVKRQAEAQRHPARERPSIYFVLFMLALALLFAGLGVWQMVRLAQKETLIAHVSQRVTNPPAELPLTSEWSHLDVDAWDFTPVRMKGTFRHDQTILVFTSIEGEGEYSGPGYWVMAPLMLDEGGTVWINRGYVPEELRDVFSDGGPAIDGVVSVTGLVRKTEIPNSFTPGPDVARHVEWVRNIDRLDELSGASLQPVAPFYVDQTKSAASALPLGGQTVLSFPNRHLEYALTWFSLAVLVPIMLGAWFVMRRRA